MQNIKVFWICPNCKTLNAWERDVCEKCLIAVDNELQAALNYKNVNRFKPIKFVTIARNTFKFTGCLRGY